MKIINILALLLFSLNAFAQYIEKPSDKYKGILEDNIFRVIVTQPLVTDEAPLALLVNYEKKLKTDLTFNSTLGLGGQRELFGEGPDRNQYALFLNASAEIKYFFTIRRRLRYKRYVYNFTAPFLSISENLLTNAIAVSNITRRAAIAGNLGSFLNLGYQLQKGRLYLHAFAGIRLLGTSFALNPNTQLSGWHASTTVGYVF